MDEFAAWLWAGHLGPGQIALRLGAAIAFSCLIGLDREIKKKPLGLRTNMLVALGAGRVLEGIIGGIGFLGAGAIIQERDRVIGATTGAGIWAVGGIGVACGFGLYVHAAAVTILALFVLTVLGLLEGRKDN